MCTGARRRVVVLLVAVSIHAARGGLSLPSRPAVEETGAPAKGAAAVSADPAKAREGPADPALQAPYRELAASIGAFTSREAPEVSELERRIDELSAKLGEREAGWAGLLWAKWGDRLAIALANPAAGERAFACARDLAAKSGDQEAIGRVLHAQGDVLERLKRREDAVTKYGEAAASFAKAGSSVREAHSRLQRGMGLYNLGRERESLPDADRAIALYRELADEPSLANALRLCGSVLKRLNRPEEALKRLDEADGIYEQRRDEQGRALVARTRGAVLSGLERFDDAVADYDRAERQFRAAGEEFSAADVTRLRGVVLLKRGDPQKAIEEFSRALPAHEAAGRERPLADLLLSRGTAYSTVGRLREALVDIDAAEAIYERLQDAGSLAMVAQNRANVHLAFGRHELALAAYEKALAVYESMGDRLGQAQIYQNRAGVLTRMGRFAEALHGMEAGGQIFGELGLPGSIGRGLLNRGGLLALIGHHQSALEDFERCAEIFRQLHGEHLVAVAETGAARALAALGRGTEALDRLGAASETFAKFSDEAQLSGVLQSRAELLLDLSRNEEAMAALTQAEDIARRLGTEHDLAVALSGSARVLAAEGRYDEGLASLEEASRLFVKQGDRLGQVWVAQGRAEVSLRRGEVPAALAGFEAAAAGIGEILRTQVQSLGSEGSIVFRRRHGTILRGALECLEKLAAPSRRDIEAAYRVVQVFHGLGVTEALAERGSLRAKEVPEDLRARHDEIKAALAAAEERRAALSARPVPPALRAKSAHDAAIAKSRDEVQDLLASLGGIEEPIRAYNHAYASVAYPQPATLAEVQSVLPKGSVLVELAADDRRTFAFIVSRESVVARRVLSNPELKALVDRVLEALRDGRDRRDGPACLQALRDLSEPVLFPLVEALGAMGPVRHLFVAADGELCRVPFEALLSHAVKDGTAAKDWPHLVRERIVSYVASGTALREQKLPESARKDSRSAGKPSFVAFAHPLYSAAADIAAAAPGAALAGLRGDRGPPGPLPGTAREVLEAAALFADAAEKKALSAAVTAVLKDPGALEPAELHGQRFHIFLRGAASEEALKSRPEVKTATVLHLACHGSADLEAPPLSHLALSRGPVDRGAAAGPGRDDGLVTLRELRDLELSAELVVLSACETHAGAVRHFEGLAGLSRAALATGAEAVLATLWKVNDDTARRFIVSFYRALLADKGTRAEALAKAKRAAIESGLSIGTWSAYVLWDAAGGAMR